MRKENFTSQKKFSTSCLLPAAVPVAPECIWSSQTPGEAPDQCNDPLLWSPAEPVRHGHSFTVTSKHDHMNPFNYYNGMMN